MDLNFVELVVRDILAEPVSPAEFGRGCGSRLSAERCLLVDVPLCGGVLSSKDCGIILVSSSIVVASDLDGECLTAVTEGDPPDTAAGAVGGRMGVGDFPRLIEVWMCRR